MLGRGGLSAFAQRGLGTLYALLLDFKNGIYQQTRTRTNLLTYSQDLSNTVWGRFAGGTGSAPTATPNYAAAPDGSMTASRVQFNHGAGTTASDHSYIQQLVTTTASQTLSVWLKTNDGSTQQFLINGGSGLTVTVTGIWQRFSVAAVSGTVIYFMHRGSVNATPAIDLLVWGAQLEAAPAASAYIPTTSAAVSVTESITDQTKLVTNKSTNYNANPTATTNMTKAGDAAAVLSVVSDTAALATANLNGYCSGNVYKLDNTSGVADAFVTVGGFTADLNTHTVSAYVRGTGTVKLGGYVSDTSLANFTLTAGYVRQSRTFVSGATNDQFRIQVTAGSVVYFILNQLEEAYQASANPIVISGGPATTGAVTDLYGYTYSRSGAKEEVGTTYGPELVTATFPITAVTNNTPVVNCSTNLTVGKTYQITYTITSSTWTGVLYFEPTTSAFNYSTISQGVGTYTITNTAVTGGRSELFRLGGGGGPTGSITFSGISVKEVIPASSFAANVPAIIPGTGYFARPAYTNLLTYSQDFTSAAWPKSTNVVTVTGGSIAPDGSSTACSWTRTVTGSTNIGQGYTKAASAIQYNFSVFAKQSTGRYLAMRAQGSYPNLADVVVDLQTGTVFSTSQNTFSVPTATVKAVGNGFYRIDFTTTTDTSSSVTMYLSFNSNGVVVDGTDSSATSSGYLWQAQVVQASDPGPIIVTTSATAAVGADVMALTNYTVPTGDFLLAAVSMISTATSVQNDLVELSDGTTNNRLVLYKTNSGNPGLAVNPQNTGYKTAQGAATVNSGQRLTLACFYSSSAGTFKLAYKVDSSAPVVITAVASPFPTLNKLTVGIIGSGNTEFVYGPVQTVLVRPGTFSDTDLTNILTAL